MKDSFANSGAANVAHDDFGIPIIDRLGDAAIFSDWPVELLDRPLTIAYAPSRRSKNWQNLTGYCRGFIEILSRHEAGQKDGLMFCPATLASSRRKTSEVIKLDLLVYDLDTGQPASEVIPRLQSSGTGFFAYTSHSHGKVKMTIPVKAVVDELELRGDPVEADLREYLLKTEKLWPTIAESARLLAIKDGECGPVCHVKTPPIDKYRIVLPLFRPFVVADFGGPQAAKKAWAHYVKTIGNSFGLRFDEACLDLARGYYTPRHPLFTSSHFTCIGGHRPIDLNDYPPYKPPKRVSRTHASRQTVSVDGRPSTIRQLLGAYGHEFDVVTWIDSLGWETRGDCSEDKVTIVCPNDHAHTNAGDSTDAGCVAMNPGATDVGRAVISCRHTSCKDLKTADFMEMIINEIVPGHGP